MQIEEDQILKVLSLKEKACKAPHTFTQEERNLYHNVYYKLTGTRKKTRCSTCLTEIYFEVKSLSKQKTIIMKSQSKFSLKPGVVIGFHGMAQDYTNANLTDRAALMILKRSRGSIKHFNSFPENWMEMVGQFDLTMKDEQLETLINGEVASSSILDGSASKPDIDPIKEALESQTKSELYEKAEQMGLPESEWKKKNKTQMVEYLFAKITS